MEEYLIGSRTKEFDFGTYPGITLSNVLVQLLLEAETNPYLKKRLGMRLLSPVTSIQTEIQALQKYWSLDRGQLITCSIRHRDGRTLLQIKSEPFGGQQAFDSYIHDRNIHRLYAELRFKLHSMDKPLLEKCLADEKILWERSPLEYQFLEFTGTLTPSRLLLHKDYLVWTELPLHDIATLTRGKDNTKKGKPGFAIGIFLIILYLAITTLVTLISNPPLHGFHLSFSPFLIAGIISLLVGYLITYDHYLIIGTPTESLKLYTKRPLLSELYALLSGNQPSPLYNSNLTPLIPPFEIKLSPAPHSPSPSEKFCPFCGMKTPADAPFCPKCGSSI